jgi:histidinol-phosphatase (PHP family)
MIANYHTHTPRCHHAVGTERAYIEAAIEAGMEELGFSDHVPYRFPDFQSGIRMAMEEMPEYVRILSDLREEYKNDIKIYIGYEAEYFPELFDGLLEELGQYPYDYLILGQHFLAPEPVGLYAGNPIYAEEDLKRYVDLSIEGLSTGKFLYMAHPDLINYIGDDEIYKKHMLVLCEAAKKMQIPLEINFTGYMTGRNYPCSRFFELAAKTGNQVIFGCDAHRPDVLTRKDLEEDCMKMVKALKLELLEKLPI